VRTKVWLELDGGFVIGEGGLALLAAIATRRSLSKAAQDIGWSYRHAWGYLRRAERALGGPLTCPLPGKGRDRGMVLTDGGECLLNQLARWRDTARAAVKTGAVPPAATRA